MTDSDPGNAKDLVKSYEDATKESYEYLFVDLRPETPEALRLRGRLLEPTNDVYIPHGVCIPIMQTSELLTNECKLHQLVAREVFSVKLDCRDHSCNKIYAIPRLLYYRAYSIIARFSNATGVITLQSTA